MLINYKKRRNRILYLFLSIFLLSTLLPVAIVSFILPETIRLIEGKEQIFNVPVIAAFKSDSSEVKINKQQSESGSIALSDKFSIISGEAGDTEVTLSVFGLLPVKKITLQTIPDIDVIPSGAAVGVRMNTDGVMVLGTGGVTLKAGGETEPSKEALRAGDLILGAGGESIENKEELTNIIKSSDGEPITFEYTRNGEALEASITPVLSDDDEYKLGIWVRDSTQGIGTITYINPENRKFGALGHGIMDVDTKRLMTIKDGRIMSSSITSSKKGKKGAPGELLGNIESSDVLGEIRSNTPFGIYGYINEETALNGETTKIGLQSEVVLGEAYILSTIDGDTPKKYAVEIESINKYSNDDSKGMVIKITDKALLNKTNGIVQGMSGSPVIQNGKLIGAVTHVFVQNPEKGYGIFIENMFKQDDNI